MPDSPAEPRYPAPLPSPRAQDMPRSAIRRIFNAAKALEAQGIDVVRLDIGDPDFPLPARISDAISAALRQGETHYSPMVGIYLLREAIAAWLIRRFRLEESAHELASRVVMHQGATQALNSITQFCCGIGEGLLLPEIYFPNYIQQCTLGGIRPHFYELDEQFVPVVSKLRETHRHAAESGQAPRALLMNSPGNPTGALFPRGVVEEIYGFCRENGLWLISDEAYCEMVFDGELTPPLLFDAQYPHSERIVLSIFSFSKSYAATGLRMGFSFSPHEDAAGLLAVMNEPFTGSLTTPLQYGMLEALKLDDAPERCAALRPRWEMCGKVLREAGLPFDPPEGGLFYFSDVSSTGLSGEEFAQRLLEEERVAVVPGGGFGLAPQYAANGRISFTPNARAQNCVRLCFAVPEARVRLGIERIAAFIRRQTAQSAGG